MNKVYKKIIFTIFVITGILLFAPSVFAQVPNFVVFENSPLFNEASFLPGDTVTRWVEITNNTPEARQIGTQATNVRDPDDLGDVMNLEIKQGATILYSGALSDFFDSDEIYLSDLGSGATNTYHYSVTFDANAEDEYQGLGLGFDFKIGFLGESISEEIYVGGGGGGDGTSTAGLRIFNEMISAIGSDSAVITWDTNLNSTTRVIYSPFYLGPVFNINNSPNYGYHYSTVEDSNKVLHHSATISGLESGVVYFFRCVSHASPDTLSPEYSFTTLEPGETSVEGEQQLGEQMGEVLGEAIIRTALPETGGLIGRITRKIGLSSKGLFDYEINILFGGLFILMMIGLVVVRKFVSK